MKETEFSDASSTLPTDVANTIQSLDSLVAQPKSPESVAAFRTHVAALSSWGKALEIEEFVTLSKATMTLFRLSPDHIPNILQLALHGFHAIYNLELQKGQSTKGLRDEQSLDLSAQVETSTHPKPDMDGYFKTSNLFIWVTGNFVFSLPSEGVAEILIPKPGQITQIEEYLGLRWHDQILPIFTLVQTPGNNPSLPEMALTKRVNPQTNSTDSTATILVINQDEHTLALSVDIDTLVTEPELTLIPFAVEAKSPSYFYGYVQRAEKQQPMLNVVLLVDQALKQEQPDQPDPFASFDQDTIVPRPITDETGKPMVMVVDDSSTLRKILTLKLQDTGFQVVQAQDGQEGLDQLQRNSAIQLVVCDIDMPHMNGFEFLSHCRRDPHFATLPVVMLSTNNDDQHRYLAKTLGANAYFGKPYEEAEFLDTLKSMVD